MDKIKYLCTDIYIQNSIVTFKINKIGIPK